MGLKHEELEIKRVIASHPPQHDFLAIAPLLSNQVKGSRGDRQGESFPKGKILLALNSG